ncbi:chorismate mutase [Aureimonas fodinaquatilis]|uniref:chorismate mutase n=1 Tax=Aureimonas fodinaquatilis TaxID=2565783 RepID=A0A5B0E1D1_9HYPH|nr:chorismate mutase [Aureimonas fodinaquatilis]KAA0971590.1 chorismate mutase [Aureimonas fodinaquatilis]
MASADQQDTTRLSELRAKIDAIDESIHRLLMQRAMVIDELIQTKGIARSGAAFRPGREADMMRRLATRHTGHLPITAVEHLWREIISTFTALQAPFSVAVSAKHDVAAAVETARFTCGFSVPMQLLPDADSVVDLVGQSDALMGIVLLNEKSGAWWKQLGRATIVARLPFIAVDGRPANEPALVLSSPLADPVPFEVECYVVNGGGPDFVPGDGFEVLAQDVTDGQYSRLIAGPRGGNPAYTSLGESLDIRAIGGYAAPLRLDR